MPKTLLMGLLVVLVLIPATAARAQNGDEVIAKSETTLILGVAIFYGLLHLLAPQIRLLLRRRDEQVFAYSLAGGIAVAYIFLQLLPELDAGHALVGGGIHFVLLVGFVAFWSITLRVHVVRAEHGESAKCNLHVGLTWAYNWLLIYALPAGIH